MCLENLTLPDSYSLSILTLVCTLIISYAHVHTVHPHPCLHPHHFICTCTHCPSSPLSAPSSFHMHMYTLSILTLVCTLIISYAHVHTPDVHIIEGMQHISKNQSLLFCSQVIINGEDCMFKCYCKRAVVVCYQSIALHVALHMFFSYVSNCSLAPSLGT